MLLGLDIASYQGYPDFAKLYAAGHRFVLTKVTGEGSYVNPYWATNRANARNAGLRVGHYDWICPQEWASPADAVARARRYLATILPLRRGELITFDFEDPLWASGPCGRAIEPLVKAYAYTLRDEAACPVGVYTGKYFLDETGASGWDWLGRDFWLWQAAPGAGMLADDSCWPATPAPFAATVIHQHQWHATSDAVGIEFDRDRFDGDEAALDRYGMPPPVEASTDLHKGEDVKEPDEGQYTVYINAAGNPVFVWNAGGQTTPDGLVGINIVDMGLTVKSATEDGVLEDRSIQHNEVQLWRERRG